MFRKIIHTSFAPNVQKDDLLLSLKLLFGLKTKEKRNVVIDIEKEFSILIGVTSAISFSSGRAALYYILKSLNIDPHSEVLLQAFTCVAVPNAIIWAGLQPVYVDINEQTLNIDVDDLKRKVTPKSRVVIVQHTFGIAADIERIIDIAKKNNLIVIEDCAHALGGTHNKKLLGTFGDVAFFSFGRDKMISSVFGGIAITNDKKIGERLRKYQNELKKPNHRFVIKQLLYAPLYVLSLSLYDVFIGKLLLKLASRFNILSKAVYPQEKTGGKPDFIDFSFDPSLAVLVKNQLKKLDSFTNHRKKRVSFYEKNMSQKNVFTTNGQPLLRYPLRVVDKLGILNWCKNRNIHLGNWYQGPIDPRGVVLQNIGYVSGSCPKAEKISTEIINLPTHINISDFDAKQIVKTVKSCIL